MTKQNKQRIFIDAIKPNYFDKELHHLRYYQRDAVKAVWESLRNDRNEMLIEMAIGTGKMRVAMALINLFLEYGFSKKILFLSSMEVMQQQVLIKFTGDFEEYTVSHLNDDDGLWKRAHIVVSTYQKVREYSLAGNEFDLVICDQADEISYTNLNEIFSVFNTCIIGFVQSDQKFKLGSNLEKSFNTDKLIYSYTLHNAIYDGYVNNINSISNINLEKNIYIEINQKIKHIKETLLLDSKEISSLEEVAISLEAVSKAIKDYGDLRQEMVKSGLDKGDIKLLGNKKEQLENFKMLLKDSNYKDNQEVSNNNSLEGVW
ncbi:DEAD/DEAH box helicase family protein, partial [Bacillus thuringiensis]